MSSPQHFDGRESARESARAPDEELDTIDLRDVVATLRRRWRLVAGVALATLGLAALIVLRAPAEYQARAVIRLEDERGALTSGIQSAAVEQLTGKTEDPLLSQLQVLRSRRVASEVVDSLGLRLRAEDAALSPLDFTDVRIADALASDTLSLRFDSDAWGVAADDAVVKARYGQPLTVGDVQLAVRTRPATDDAALYVLPQSVATERLLEELRASPRQDTDVVDVSYTSTDPVLAATVVNAMIDEFREQSARSAQEQARMRRIFIEEQLAATDSQLVDVQLALTRFREQNQVFSSREMLSTQQMGLMQLEVRREELAVDRQIFRSLLAQLERAEADGGRSLRTLVSSPGIAANPVIATLYEQLVRYEASLDSLTAGSWSAAPTNPDVQRLRSLVDGTRERLADAVQSHVAALDARIAALDDLRRRNAAELAALPPTEAEEARLVQQLATMQGVADQLRAEYQRARIEEAVEVGRVEIVDRAIVPLEPVGAGKGLKLALGLMLGLMLGAGAAFLREHLSQSVQGKEDVERLLRVPAIAIVPRIGSANGRHRLLPSFGRNGHGGPSRPAMLVAANDRNSRGAEAYRTLRTNLIFSQAVQEFHRVVVTSSSPGEGKTTTAANLAITLAQQGMKVLLMDCDLRRPQLHEAFGIAREPGLTERLIRRASTEQVVRATSIEGLKLMPCGAIPPNPSELVGGGAMEALLDELGASYDMVVLDTPPLLGASDAAVLGAEADGVLLVVRAGDTERGAAEAAMAQLRNVGARVIGAVLNDPDGAVPQYGGHYYYAYYGARS